MATVRKIASSELDDIVRKRKDKALVLFFGNWCQDCRDFKPLWERWTKDLAGPVYAVEILRGGPEWDEWSIDEVPTVVAYSMGFELARADGVIAEGDLDTLWKTRLSMR